VLLGLSFFGAQIAFAGPVTVPNAFTSGTTARASEVNSNFSAIETAVNDNDSRISSNANAVAAAIQGARSAVAVFDSGGNEIGLLVTGIYSYDGPTRISLLTDQGYVFTLSVGSGEIAQVSGIMAQLYYTTPDCSGLPYAGSSNGLVFRARTDGAVYYVHRDSTPISIVNGSTPYHGGPCNAVDLEHAWVVLPNDAAITGVSDQPHPLPIKIGLP